MKIVIEVSKEDGTLTQQEKDFIGEPDDFLEQYQAENNFDDLHYSHLSGETKAIGKKYKKDRSGTTEIHVLGFSW